MVEGGCVLAGGFSPEGAACSAEPLASGGLCLHRIQLRSKRICLSSRTLGVWEE
ncbi:hypothetical protein [Albibacterium bauzanense]|uniref:hypothetical protein n=1 Tax=Albibacterium bauzanense TaxID=653929 RepID=UPI0014050301|nr:hypothetical protein [Albibacterium bauzanense]